MRISKWRHPLMHWRCVHTPSCCECRHATLDLSKGCSHYGCTNTHAIDYMERTRGVYYDQLDASLVRGTRRCRFEHKPDEEERLDELLGEIEERVGNTDD